MRGGAAGGRARARRTPNIRRVSSSMCWPSTFWGAPAPGRSIPTSSMAKCTAPGPIATSTREDFDQAVDFVATGGYALKGYERYAKLKPPGDGRLRLAHPLLAQQYRLNIGTIVEAEMLKVRLASVATARGKRIVTGGRVLGELEEWFLSQLRTGRHLPFAGEVLRFEGLDEFGALATAHARSDPMIPSYEGGKFPLSTYLAERVREMLGRPESMAVAAAAGARLALRAALEIGASRGRTRCWSKPSRARNNIISCAIPSKAGWRIRRSACC